MTTILNCPTQLFCEKLPQEVVNNNFSRKGNALTSPFYINYPGKKGKIETKVIFKIKNLIKKQDLHGNGSSFDH
jgi:hypothetical protein